MYKTLRNIVYVTLLAILYSCSAVRYVPQSDYLLRKNKVNIHYDGKMKGVSISQIEDYLQQRPNKRFLGIGLYLGVYNMTDSSKHSWWHRFWAKKIGEAPVILDSALVRKSCREMETYVASKGFLSSTVSDTIITNRRRKATVIYNVKLQDPYLIKSLKYNILDTYIRPIVESDSTSSNLKVGKVFSRQDFENERMRISEMLRNRGFWSFNQSYINFTVDSSHSNNTVDITLNLRRLRVNQTEDGEAVYINHPLYRIAEIAINTAYTPTELSTTSSMTTMDTTSYNGMDIYYNGKLNIRPDIIGKGLGLSEGMLFDQNRIEQSYNAIRSLGYSANILFSPIENQGLDTMYVYAADGSASTSERFLSCLVLCTASVKQNISADFEASTTSDYYSLALTLGYQNPNLFRGAENFSISFRGAYEFLKSIQGKNSFEFGVTTSLDLPRFLLPFSKTKYHNYKYSSTKFTLSYNIQNRPFYRRALVSGVFGYSWTMRNGARFTINPADVNVINVPWIDQHFKDSIANPFLLNSYSSQLIAGASAMYYYNTNADIKQNGFTFRAAGDINGNLISLITLLASKPVEKDGERYYNLFGLRFAQYARFSADVSQRINFGQRSQIAWRFLAAAGFSYGNSSVLPFERMFFAGGSNSMRGWQVRTLGPGGSLINDVGPHPNQLGDIRLEANLEYRVNVVGGLNLSAFLDCGNIWMNGKGEKRPEARFKFDTFYKQLALNTGIGLRYDFGFFLVRLDWGIKLHNPNAPMGQRWFKQMGINDTALHFALGLPF